jgi:hypothetical protein
MTMAKMRLGRTNMLQYAPASTPVPAYSAGDIIMIGNLPCVAHDDNPPSSTGYTSNPQGALSIQGGIYQIAADAAYANGTYVYWDTVKQQVTTIASATAFPFGWLVTGAGELLSDGGPTGAGILCDVYHFPQGAQQALASSLYDTPRNVLDGGDMNVNPWQRTTSITGIANTVTYTADRWFAYSAGSGGSVSVSQVADTTVLGFSNNLKLQRALNNTNTSAISLGQVLETLDCVRLQGQKVTLSFYAKNGANYSGGALTVAVNHSTTAGNDTAAHLVAASTNWQSVPTIINTTQALGTTKTRYQFTGTVPNNATQLGVLFTWTPTGTAGADDSVSFDGLQLEAGSGATPFEHRDIELELALCQRYYVRFVEVNGAMFATGVPTGANTQAYSIYLPTPMRAAPTVTWTVGGFKTNTDGAGNATITTPAAGAAHSLTVITLTSANTLTAAAHSIGLFGTGTTGFIDASSDL